MTSRKVYALGSSQWPLLRSGQKLDIVEVGPAHVCRGDLLVYRRGALNICHRVLSIQKKEDGYWFLMKGDANPVADGWICSRQVLGKLDRVEGRSINRPAFRWFSRCLYWHSWVQWAFFHTVFESRLGVSARQVRERFYHVPLFFNLFKAFSALRLLERVFAGKSNGKRRAISRGR